MDLIDRQQALMLFAGDVAAQNELSNLPAVQPEPKWIPVTEQLPEIKEHHISEACIVYCKHSKHGYTVGFAELEENIFGQVGWNCERDDEYHEALGTVLAWMPLPEPYHEGGEQE